jgi:mediator of RNA polymerase II transcription subunit 5
LNVVWNQANDFQIVRNLCVGKDTMALKTICDSITSKPQLLDVIMQFTAPVTILQPLCELLDGWRYEDDQGRFSVSNFEPSLIQF